MTDSLTRSIQTYYRETLRTHGPSARGLDWPSDEGHDFRLNVALDQLDLRDGDAVLDFGCGYGSLLQTILERKIALRKYVGYDLVPEMLDHAKSIWGSSENTRWVNQFPSEETDYSFAIGTFHVRPAGALDDFMKEIQSAVRRISLYSRKGWVASFLETPSEEGFHRDHLQYFSAESLEVFLRPSLAGAVNLRIIKSPKMYELLAVATANPGHPDVR